MASSSNQSSSWDHESWDNDVFLSFRGPDTRNTFTSHLNAALKSSGIRTFIDDEELRGGSEIKPELRKAIRGSKMSIIVFSTNYASSRWCLDELVEILDCRRTKAHIVLPIFYDVEPYVVRHQKESYAKAFEKHKLNEKLEVVNKWRNALTEAADLSGHSLKHEDNGNEARFIQNIIQKVRPQVDIRCLNLPENLVGINSHVESIYDLLSAGSDGVRIIGIYGMGGVGKTTVSKAVFNHYKQLNHFQGTAYIENLKDVSKQKDGELRLQEKLLRQLGEKDDTISNSDEGINKIKRFCQSRRVLILLDDFDSCDQINKLAGHKSWFSTQSKIILVTRDAKLLKKAQVEHTYEMMLLNEEESLKLFRKHAIPSEAQNLLSIEIARYCGGLPLALEVIGSDLYGETIEYWENALKEFQSTPHKTVHDRLKISYNSLCKNARNIFLDSACFFIGWKREHVIVFWDGCGYSKNFVKELSDKCLLKFDENDCLWMHDLLRDMGREIVREASGGSLEKQSRYWIRGDILRLLRSDIKEKVNVEGIYVPRTVNLESDKFSMMNGLRLLIIRGVGVEGSLENLCGELRWLTWQGCPLRSLPFGFCPSKLVGLDMKRSLIKKPWEGIKILDLSCCNRLEETPDFTGTPSLERLVLTSCDSLEEVRDSIGQLHSLVSLQLKGCCKLKSLPTSICSLRSLQDLDLSYCFDLQGLPEQLGKMECLLHLNLCNCRKIRHVPESICNLSALQTLDLYGCGELVCLPEELGNMKSLLELNVRHCRKLSSLPASTCNLLLLQKLDVCGALNLNELPERLGSLKSLRTLDASFTQLEKLPDSIKNLKELEMLSFSRRNPQSNDFSERFVIPSINSSLKALTLKNCGLHDEDITDVIRMSLSSMQYLYLSGNNLCIPSSNLCLLANLTKLDLSDCKSLTSLSELPPSLTKLVLSGCTSLVSLPELPSSNLCLLANLAKLDLSDCRSLLSLSELPPSLTELVLRGCTSLLSLREVPPNVRKLDGRGCTSMKVMPNLCLLANLTKLDLSDCKSLTSLSELPPSLTKLVLSGCTSLVSLPELPPNLRKLDGRGCTSMKVMPNLSNSKLLEELDLSNCNGLVELQGLENLNQLQFLQLAGCNNMARNANINKRFFQRYFEYGEECSLPKWESPDWIEYESKESTITFQLPRSLPHNFKGIILWFDVDSDIDATFDITIRNNTRGEQHYHFIWCRFEGSGTWVRCIKEIDYMLLGSGDSFTISITQREGLRCRGVGFTGGLQLKAMKHY